MVRYYVLNFRKYMEVGKPKMFLTRDGADIEGLKYFRKSPSINKAYIEEVLGVK